MTTENISQTVQRYKRLKFEIEDKQAQLTELANELKAALDAQNVNEIIGKTWKIKRSTFEQSRLDSKRLKVEMPTIYNDYLMKISTTRFTVS